MTDKTFQAERSLDLLQAGGAANRVVATADGVTMAMSQVTTAMLGPGLSARAATKIVATNYATWPSSTGMQTSADYICDGVADDVQINAALNALPAVGGTVLLAEGLYILAAPIVFNGARRRLIGMGMDITYLQVMASGGAPINTTIIQVNNDYNELHDLTIDCNKANNAAQTSTTAVTLSGNNSPLIQRVRMANMTSYGFVVLANVANGVIRDCLVENSGLRGAVFRAPTGQPLVVSGCTFRGNAGHGVWCDSGPVVLTDCAAIGNSSYGFNPDSSALLIMHQCLAQSNASSGWHLEGGCNRALLSHCRSVSNGGHGYRSDGPYTMFIECIGQGSTGNNHGLFTVGADCLVYGCKALSNYHGFAHATASRAQYVGCASTDNPEHGFSIGGGSVLIGGCHTYGRSTSGYGLVVDGGGANHIIDGNRIKNHGGDGIVIGGPLSNVMVSSTYISDISLLTNASYKGIALVGDACFIHDNILRDPAAGNRPLYGIYVDGPSVNSMLGFNDAFGSGVASPNPPELYDLGTGTRRICKLLLDYTVTSDLISGATAAAVWTDVLPNQTFTVLSPSSLIEIAVRGSILGGGATPGTIFVTRLLIDGATVKNLSGECEQTAGYQNIMSGVQPIRIEGLTAGPHTVKLQILSNVASNAYCRCATASAQEFMAIQVSEWSR